MVALLASVCAYRTSCWCHCSEDWSYGDTDLFLVISPDFAGKSELVSFYSWLDFTDNLIKSSTPIISEALSEAVREVFLEKCLEVNFNQIMAERDAEQEQSGENHHREPIVRVAFDVFLLIPNTYLICSEAVK